MATLAEERKASKYSCLVPRHSFTPVTIESLGPMGGKDTSLPEGAESEGTAMYWQGDGSCLPSAMSLLPSREEMYYLWLGLCGTLWVWTHFIYSIYIYI